MEFVISSFNCIHRLFGKTPAVVGVLACADFLRRALEFAVKAAEVAVQGMRRLLSDAPEVWFIASRCHAVKFISAKPSIA